MISFLTYLDIFLMIWLSYQTIAFVIELRIENRIEGHVQLLDNPAPPDMNDIVSFTDMSPAEYEAYRRRVRDPL